MGKISFKIKTDDGKVWTEFDWKDITMIDVSQTLMYMEIIRNKFLKIAEKGSNQKTANWDKI